MGKEAVLINPGDVVFCPPGVVNWHGSVPDSTFAHIAINPYDNYDVTWDDFPSEAQYKLTK